MGITLWQYYINQAANIEDKAFDGINTLADWQAIREERRKEFFSSMGLESTEPTCPLDVKILGEFQRPGFRAKKMAFQILPQCWTSATFYLPDPLPKSPLPAVLNACGHAQIGVLHYHPRLAMWARRGYAAMAFDTIEQHDACGNHHGTYYRTQYDWISMGYTAAGGELWNSLRALDVLSAQPEVDSERIGVTGSSGGGAHSFFLAIADERIKAVAAGCGVAMQRSSIEDRHLNGHCDCMYFMNLYRRCTSEFAALIAPRPLLFCFAAEDSLFSRSEYLRLTEQTRRIYRLYGRENLCNLFEYPGPHGYKPQTFEAINDLFDAHVAGKMHPQMQPVAAEVEEQDVTIFNGQPPASNKMRLIPETLSSSGSIALPMTPDEWPNIRSQAIARLKRDVLGFLDSSDAGLEIEQVGDWIEIDAPPPKTPIRRKAWRGTADGMDIWMFALTRPMDDGKAVIVLCDRNETAYGLLADLGDVFQSSTLVFIEGRTAGWSAARDNMEWDMLRGGALIGLSPLILQLQDMKLILSFLRKQPFLQERKLFLYGKGDAGAACLYQAAMDDSIAGAIAEDMPESHRTGAFLPGILRVMDLDHVAGLIGPRPVALVNPAPARRNWASRLYKRLDCPERYILRKSLYMAAQQMFEYV